MDDMIDVKFVRERILREAIKIEQEEAENDTCGGPDPRVPDAKIEKIGRRIQYRLTLV